jgi:periplasmic copper chaperone A
MRVIVPLVALLLICCSDTHPVVVEGAWVRKILPTQAVTAGYLEMINTGDGVDRLMSVSTPAFRVVELHDMSVDDKGVMRMRKAGPISVGSGEKVTMKRGGYHLMLIEPHYAIAVGNDIPLTLHFEKAGEVTVAARVKDE